MSIERETQKESAVPIERESGVIKHEHNGVDSPRVKFTNIEKVINNTADISNEFTATEIPNAPLFTSLSGVYADDYNLIESRLNLIAGYMIDLVTQLDVYQNSQKDVSANLHDNGLLNYE